MSKNELSGPFSGVANVRRNIEDVIARHGLDIPRMEIPRLEIPRMEMWPDPADFERLPSSMLRQLEQIQREMTAFLPMAPWVGLRPPPRTATAVLERPVGVPWTLPPVMPDDEYLKVAAAIGLDSPALTQARLDRFLVERGWPVYDNTKVSAYLQSLADQEAASRQEWTQITPVWKPLRKADVATFLSSKQLYGHAVPLHALLKVAELETEFGRGVLTFAVSDYEAKVPDPFLMVTAAGIPFYVIDVWDEPGFQG